MSSDRQTQFASGVQPADPRNAKLDALTETGHTFGTRLESREPIAAQDILDEHLDRFLNQLDSPTADEATGTRVVAPPHRDGTKSGHVEIWLRRGAGEKVFLCEMGLAAFEAVTHGEVWTRRSDGQPVFMDEEELGAYYMVDAYGWGDTFKGGPLGDHVRGHEDGQSEAGDL